MKQGRSSLMQNLFPRLNILGTRTKTTLMVKSPCKSFLYVFPFHHYILIYLRSEPFQINAKRLFGLLRIVIVPIILLMQIYYMGDGSRDVVNIL